MDDCRSALGNLCTTRHYRRRWRMRIGRAFFEFGSIDLWLLFSAEVAIVVLSEKVFCISGIPYFRPSTRAQSSRMHLVLHLRCESS